MKKESGFTLIEVIVSLLLVGLLASIAGLSVYKGMEGYLMASENAALTQTSQLTLERLRREILLLNGVTAASGTTFQFSNSLGARTIGLDGGTVKIAEGALALTSGDILVEEVNSFSLAYFKGDGTTGWVQGVDTLQDLAEVQINITLNHAISGGISFSTSVNPRNNGMLNAPVE